MADLQLFEDVIAEIAARLDLRDPNQQAIQTLVSWSSSLPLMKCVTSSS